MRLISLPSCLPPSRWIFRILTAISCATIVGCNDDHTIETTNSIYVTDVLRKCNMLVIRYSDSHGVIRFAMCEKEIELVSLADALSLGRMIRAPELWKTSNQVTLDLWVFSPFRPPQSLRVAGPTFILLGVQGYELGFELKDRSFFERILGLSAQRQMKKEGQGLCP